MKNIKIFFHKGYLSQPSLKTLYEHKCSCGKLLEEHKIQSCSSTLTWNVLKQYYDLGTCDLKDKKISGTPNGFGKFRNYKFIK